MRWQYQSHVNLNASFIHQGDREEGKTKPQARKTTFQITHSKLFTVIWFLMGKMGSRVQKETCTAGG